MEFRTENNTLILIGDMFVQDLDLLVGALNEYVMVARGQVSLDLSQVESADVLSLQALVSTKKTADLSDKAFCITHISDTLRDNLQQLGLDAVLRLTS